MRYFPIAILFLVVCCGGRLEMGELVKVPLTEQYVAAMCHNDETSGRLGTVCCEAKYENEASKHCFLRLCHLTSGEEIIEEQSCEP